jgi:hypothetical protein
VAAGELVRASCPLDHVVGEDGGQQPAGVAEGLVEGGLGEGGEGVVGGREHGDAPGRFKGADQVALLTAVTRVDSWGVGGGGGHRVLRQRFQVAGLPVVDACCGLAVVREDQRTRFDATGSARAALWTHERCSTTSR